MAIWYNLKQPISLRFPGMLLAEDRSSGAYSLGEIARYEGLQNAIFKQYGDYYFIRCLNTGNQYAEKRPN
jgi:hypothetical protein